MELGIPTDLSYWTLLNSQATATVVGSVATLVGALIGGRIVQRVGEQTEQQKKQAAQQGLTKRGSDEVVAPSPEEIARVEQSASDGRGPFSDASRDFKKISGAVDRLIGQVTDGRRKRKYVGLQKTDLREHVFLLRQDDMFGLSTAQRLNDAITAFYSSRRNPSQISPDVVQMLASAAREIEGIAK